MGPEWIVLMSSGLGVLISSYLLLDAFLDHRAVLVLGLSDLKRATREALIGETIRLIILLCFLFISVAVILDNHLGDLAVWLLVLVPIIVTVGSIYSWVQRIRTKKEHGLKPRERPREHPGKSSD